MHICRSRGNSSNLHPSKENSRIGVKVNKQPRQRSKKKKLKSFYYQEKGSCRGEENVATRTFFFARQLIGLWETLRIMHSSANSSLAMRL